MTSLVHIGDFHAAPGPRNMDRYLALDQIINQGLALPRLGAWLWPGDLFDAASSVEDRNALDASLLKMANRAPVVICYGNHDHPGDLDGFRWLRATHEIFVVDRPCVAPLHLATGETASIFVLPYPQRAGLVAAGVAPQDLVGTAGDLLEPIFIEAAHALAQARQQGHLTLMIGHVNVSGSIVSAGQPNIGREIELSPKHLERLGPIPKLLNHIHKPQEIGGAHYAGSVCRMDYGEIEPKRYLRLDYEAVDVWTVEARPLDIAPMFRIEGRLTRTGFTLDSRDETADAEIHRRLEARDWAGCDLRVRATYRASEKAALVFSGINELFAGALRLKVETIAELDRDVRLPEVAAATTLPAKLAAYRKEATLPESVATKLDALQGDPAQLLEAVRAQLRTYERLDAPVEEVSV